MKVAPPHRYFTNSIAKRRQGFTIVELLIVVVVIAILTDENCWMLTNLKLGSTSGSITLTPSDSDVGGNFTLPQLTTTGAAEYDLPRAYGPVPGDTGSGATNYGYLYNYSGPFKGLLSGGWYGSFYDSGAAGELWSASVSPSPGQSEYAFHAYFSPSDVAPDSNDLRSSGRGVRCLLR